MTDQTFVNRAKERGKLAVRSGLMRLDLDIHRDPWARRLVRMMAAHDIDTVIDVGANVGQFGALLRLAGYAGRLVSFEPLPGAFEVLSRRCRDDDRWECHNLAVGPEGEIEINVAANSYSSSVRPMANAHLDAAPESRYVGRELVSVVPLTEVLSRHAIVPEQTLLKVDTQGYELEVLDSAGPELARMAAIQLELSLVELYVGQALMATLMARMDDLGLELFAFEPGISSRTGRMLQLDGLFVREPK